jgi:hypothetical protein
MLVTIIQSTKYTTSCMQTFILIMILTSYLYLSAVTNDHRKEHNVPLALVLCLLALMSLANLHHFLVCALSLSV